MNEINITNPDDLLKLLVGQKEQAEKSQALYEKHGVGEVFQQEADELKEKYPAQFQLGLSLYRKIVSEMMEPMTLLRLALDADRKSVV